MKTIITVFCLLSALVYCNCKIIGKIVGGHYASMENFPHAVYMFIKCGENSWSCGASVLNQRIMLSAAHCLEACTPTNAAISAFFGETQKEQGLAIKVVDFKTHSDYDPEEIMNDIALLALSQKLQYSNIVKRVAILRNPPWRKTAYVAGWGLIDEKDVTPTEYLKYAKQLVYRQKRCERILGSLPAGTICAALNDETYTAAGDSGSALVVQGYIQIGLVSYKEPGISRSTVVYTNVSYFYNWIKKNTKLLYCQNFSKNMTFRRSASGTKMDMKYKSDCTT